MKTCLGVLLAESLNAKVTAVYVTGNSTRAGTPKKSAARTS